MVKKKKMIFVLQAPIFGAFFCVVPMNFLWDILAQTRKRWGGQPAAFFQQAAFFCQEAGRKKTRFEKRRNKKREKIPRRGQIFFIKKDPGAGHERCPHKTSRPKKISMSPTSWGCYPRVSPRVPQGPRHEGLKSSAGSWFSIDSLAKFLNGFPTK